MIIKTHKYIIFAQISETYLLINKISTLTLNIITLKIKMHIFEEKICVFYVKIG